MDAEAQEVRQDARVVALDEQRRAAVGELRDVHEAVQHGCVLGEEHAEFEIAVHVVLHQSAQEGDVLR